MAMKVYRPEIDELTNDGNVEQDVPANNNVLPQGVEKEVAQLEKNQNTEIDEIEKKYNDLIGELDNEENPYDALIRTTQKRKVHDPRVTRARQAIGSLYDALQIVGVASTMGSQRGVTPSSVQMTSAAQAQNEYAERMRQMQLEEDNSYNERKRSLQLSREAYADKLRKERADLSKWSEDSKRAVKKFYATEINKLRKSAADRQTRINVAVKRNVKKNKESSKSKKILLNNNEYLLDNNKETDFCSAVGYMLNTHGIDIQSVRDITGLSGTALYIAVLRTILDEDIEDLNEQAKTDAEKIINNYFDRLKQEARIQRQKFDYRDTTDWNPQ